MGLTDPEICPECGGRLSVGWDGYLYCENDSSHQFFIDDDGELTSDAEYDDWM